MSTANGIVDFETDFLPYFKDKYKSVVNNLAKALIKSGENPPDVDGALEGLFDGATLLVSNNPKCSIVPFDTTHNDRLILYGLIVAHMVTLMIRGAGFVGQLSSGSQGSVSMGVNTLQMAGNTAPYWMQTQYGAQYWMASAPYRAFLYISPLPVNWK